ncbi:MAG: PD-(D/E)XK nuclease family transposase [Coriobacteriia bacterium]|nr:PD-(D/E)XK nuclease family transposase [Coriobacteriia bacterium]
MGDYQEQIRERLRSYTMLDDAFMSAVLTDNVPGTELVLRTVLGKPGLKVIEQHTQHQLKNLRGRSSVLDVHAIDDEGTRYDIEIQNDAAGASLRRARYNASLMDASALEEGASVSELPECYVIFITRTDVMGQGLPLYHVDRQILETGEAANDGSHLVYVNCSCTNGPEPLQLLINDLRCADPDKMTHEELASRARSLKDGNEVNLMGTYLEGIFYKGKAEGKVEGKAEGKIEALAESAVSVTRKSGVSIDDALSMICVPDNLRDTVREAAEELDSQAAK